MKRRRTSGGFTFLEIMLVVVIIGILFGIVGVRMAGRGEEAKRAATQATMQNIMTALDSYEMDVGEYPSTGQGLKALVKRPPDISEDDWNGPYLKTSVVPKDSWKKYFVYTYPAEEGDLDYDLISRGRKDDDSEDDITNFSTEEEEF